MHPYTLSQFFLLRKGSSEEIPEIKDKVKEDLSFGGIRCPLCRWRPSKSSRWFCGDLEYPENFHRGCGTRWNTFETRGVCPGCSHQWKWTVCLSCHRASPHEDWYEDK